MQHGNPTSFVGPLVAHFENLDKIQYICIGIFIFVRVDNSQVNSCDGICVWGLGPAIWPPDRICFQG